MPELSRFFGIIIRMFFEVRAKHKSPHFHAYYQEHSAVFSISPIDILAGSFPEKQRRLVEAWAEIHQAELVTDWNLLQRGEPPYPIKPLR